MKIIQIEIPKGKEAKWVNGVLTLVDEQPIEFKFNVGDKVTFKGDKTPPPYTITDRFVVGKSSPAYKLDDCENVDEDVLELYIEPQGITERIKTFEDAVEWCKDNWEYQIVETYNSFVSLVADTEKDVVSYLKLRIITCALNEGWEPTFEEGEKRWYFYYFGNENIKDRSVYDDIEISYPKALCFKTEELAEYAATQFKDIYMDFCLYK